MNIRRSGSGEMDSSASQLLLEERESSDNTSPNGYSSTRTDNEHAAGSQQYTMQEAIDHYGFGRFQVKISCLLGLCYMAESMEMMLLSILAPILRCVWHLTGTEEALLTTVVFGGTVITTTPWGAMFDKFGRKASMTYFALTTCYFGVLSALSPHFLWMLFLRFIVGLCVGGAPQCMTYYVEFLPTKFRGQCLLGISILWAVGAMFLVLLPLVTVPTLGWRWMVGLTAAPLLTVVLMYRALPETPRFCIAHGNLVKAEEELRKIAVSNGKQPFTGVLHDPLLQKKEKSRLRDIFHPAYLKTTVLVSAIWICSNVCYFGIALLSASLFTITDGCHGYDASSVSSTESLDSCTATCKSLTVADYLDLLVTTMGDIPGILFAMLLMAKVKRNTGFIIMFLSFALVMLACNLCMARTPLVALLFIARALSSGIGQSATGYTAEVYPTTIRAVGMGFGSTCHKVCSMFLPFVTQALIQVSVYIPITFFAVLGLTGAVASYLLPIETKDQEILDVVIDGSNKKKERLYR